MNRRRTGRPRGGKGGSEPRARIRLREIRVMEQILEGRTQHQIAESLDISQPAVSKIVRRMEERLLADVAFKVERQRASHTFRLEHLYAEAMRAWGQSKQDATRRRQRKSEGAGAKAGAGGGTFAELVSENRHGDPRFLDEARKTLVDLRKVWGVDAPERLAVQTSMPFSSLSDTALQAEIERQDRLLEQIRSADALPPRSTQHEEGGSDEEA